MTSIPIIPETAAAGPALERRLGRLGLSGKEDTWVDRYLLCEHLVDPMSAYPRQRFEAVARFIRDLVAHRWVKTRQARATATEHDQARLLLRTERAESCRHRGAYHRYKRSARTARDVGHAGSAAFSDRSTRSRIIDPGRGRDEPAEPVPGAP